MTDTEPRTISDLLDRIEQAANGETVSVGGLVREFGDRSVTPFILITALLMVTPLSGIPGMPTIAAVLIVLLSLQALFGRRRLWLPAFLTRRTINTGKLLKAVSWMRKPGRFLDRHSHKRLAFLTRPPLRWLNLLLCALVPTVWPLLELLPFVTTIGAITVSLLAFGLFTRDGLYLLLGYTMIGAIAGIGVTFLR